MIFLQEVQQNLTSKDLCVYAGLSDPWCGKCSYYVIFFLIIFIQSYIVQADYYNKATGWFCFNYKWLKLILNYVITFLLYIYVTFDILVILTEGLSIFIL